MQAATARGGPGDQSLLVPLALLALGVVRGTDGPPDFGRSCVSAHPDPYVRVYYRVISDPRFENIYTNARALGTWLQLLLIADGMFPAPAPIPAYVHGPSLRLLVDAGLVDLRTHSQYVVHGLASERQMRSDSARNAAAVRWHSARNADQMPLRNDTKRYETNGSHSDFDRRVEATQRELKKLRGEG